VNGAPGERQQIALARAFLREARIVILEEPTSALDTDTAAALVDIMERPTAGRMTIIIAHRHHTLRHCDLQLLLSHGRVVVQAPDWTSRKSHRSWCSAEHQAGSTNDPMNR